MVLRIRVQFAVNLFEALHGAGEPGSHRSFLFVQHGGDFIEFELIDEPEGNDHTLFFVQERQRLPALPASAATAAAAQTKR